MPVHLLYFHRLVVERFVESGTDDDYGQATGDWVVIGTAQGQIQPASGRQREMALTSGAGVDVGDYVGYLLPIDLNSADRIQNLDDPTLVDDDRFEVVGRPRPLFNGVGQLDHLEADLRLVKAPAPIPALSGGEF